jgi:hypothetical protein
VSKRMVPPSNFVVASLRGLASELSLSALCPPLSPSHAAQNLSALLYVGSGRVAGVINPVSATSAVCALNLTTRKIGRK